MDTRQFVLQMIEWLQAAYKAEQVADTREEIVNAIESITNQSIGFHVFDEVKET